MDVSRLVGSMPDRDNTSMADENVIEFVALVRLSKMILEILYLCQVRAFGSLSQSKRKLDVTRAEQDWVPMMSFRSSRVLLTHDQTFGYSDDDGGRVESSGVDISR
ncbi:hypothetical protein MFLAVUS_004219 [Mucor flavus]|uniref:Uncharacterized protein n=1 Tax=Mucor flavus TaxID=439312 RepID=A0ABP9YVA2_9FUNG